MSVRGFFEVAVIEAERMLGRVELHRQLAAQRTDAPPVPSARAVLDRALTRAMVERGDHPWAFLLIGYRLDAGQGAIARARLLIAVHQIGLADLSMLSGETVADWLGRSLERLGHEQILPLLRAAAHVGRVNPRDLEQRAP